MKIAILNCYSRNSLAIIKSLDDSIELVGGAGEINSSLKPEKIFKHKRVRDFFRYADPGKKPEHFISDLVSAFDNYNIDGVIGSGTTITNKLSEFKKEIENRSKAKVIVEDYEKLSDKEKAECRPFTNEDGTEVYFQPKKSARNYINKWTGEKIPWREIFSDKVFTDKVLDELDKNVIKPKFKYSSISEVLADELAELEDSIETSEDND